MIRIFYRHLFSLIFIFALVVEQLKTVEHWHGGSVFASLPMMCKVVGSDTEIEDENE